MSTNLSIRAIWQTREPVTENTLAVKRKIATAHPAGRRDSIAAPMVSVVIRNLNESEHLKHVLSALHNQLYRSFEIVVVDNESTDDSIEVAERFGARVISIPDFSYGRALNLGFEACKGELVVVLSAHSVPIGRYFLTECVESLSNEKFAAGRMIHSGKPVDIDRWIEPEILTRPNDDFISKGSLASGCVIRRSVWEKIPFDETAIAAEDKIWAEAVLRAGYSIVSPIPAFYFYRKRRSSNAELHKNYNELLAVKDRFGVTLGFVDIPKSRIPGRFARAILGAMASLGGEIYFEWTKAYLTFKFRKHHENGERR